MKVLFAPEVRLYFRELEIVLYEKEYFGFEESAIRYVRELIFEIEQGLHTAVKRKAPAHFERYGRHLYYAIFGRNRRTQWYVFFNVYETGGELIYLVRYIGNNHVIAQHFNS